MFSRDRRVSTELFEQIIISGQRAQSGHFSLYFMVLNDQKSGRLAVAVPKKLVRTAVGRNLYKRKIRGLLKPVISSLKPGSASVIMPKVAKLSSAKDVIMAELTDLLSNNQLLT